MELITTKTILALDIGVNNNLFGGIMLSELDKAGAAYASQICDSPRLVTKKFEEVIFEKPGWTIRYKEIIDPQTIRDKKIDYLTNGIDNN